ncbi:MAG TPA: hypothetical protein DCG67_20100 [Pseudomonas sp.]|uniref:DUF5906 domain-containing protein n=1 Tax=Stutzerimonas balearica TaxID=74829 RepID=UPI000EC36BD9|nr:hypothetical protein [Pseudomonas sp.]
MTDHQITLAELPGLLRFIPADSREVWVQVGMGVKDSFGQDGWDAWDDWSQSGAGYKAADAKAVWRSFRKGGVGIASVVKLAKEYGWQPEKRELTAEDKRRLKAEAEARRALRQAEIEADEARASVMREAVASACELIWTKHCKPQGVSPYLERKQVGAFGVGFFHYTVVLAIDDERQRCDVWVGSEVREFFANLPKPRPDSISFLMFKKGSIAIPLRDAAGKLWSLQAINEQGTKLFPKYGRKAGCRHVLGDLAGATVIGEAEGYATAASVHMAKGWPVAMALDSGNMPAVARDLAAQCPDALLVVAGDDDPTKPGNPGRKKAEAAAGEVGGIAAFPTQPAEGEAGQDWNDVHVAWGLEVVAQQLDAALAAPLPLTPSGDPAAEAAPSHEGGGGMAWTAERVAQRFALVEGKTNVYDQFTRAVMKKTAFEALVTKPLAKAWMDSPTKKVIGEAQAERLASQAKLEGKAKKAAVPGMAPAERYVYLDGSQDIWDRQLRQRLPARAVQLALGDAFTLWLNSPERQVVPAANLVFDPRMRKSPETHINTFEGLPLAPLEDMERCAGIVRMLKFLCNGDEAAVHWLTCWLAYPLQNVGAKMDTAVLLHSTMEGSGKSFLLSDIMREIYGDYGATVGQGQLDSSWTAWQSNKLYGVFEEVVSRDQRYNQVGKIKHMVTGKTVRIESKFVNGWEEANYMNAVFLSNEILPWPISENDRRMFVMWPEQTLDERLQKRVAWEIANDGIRAFYHYLLSFDLGAFDERTRPPKTAARQRLVELSRSGWETFLVHWRAGYLGVPFDVALTSDIHDLFLEWCSVNKEHSLTATKLSCFLGTQVPKPDQQIHWYDDFGKRRFSMFFLPSPPPNLSVGDARAMGALVKAFRDRAAEAGWSPTKWEKCKGWVEPFKGAGNVAA